MTQIFLFKLANKIKVFFFHIIGSFLLNGIGFYNKFPLIYSDSSTYIHYGFIGQIPVDKPWLYCWFVRHSSLATSLWFTIIFQGIILNYFIYIFIKHFFLLSFSKAAFITLIINIILITITPIGIYVSQIMPDIFISITFLGILIFIFCFNKLVLTTKLIISLLFIFSVGMHISNAVVVILFSIGLIIYVLYTYLRKNNLMSFSRQTLIWIFSIFLLSALSSPIVNYFKSGHFQFSQTSHVILMARMVENGILTEYFNQYPEESRLFRLYEYRDSLPTNSGDFLWSARSPLYKTGSWVDSKKEYEQIISNTYNKSPLVKLHLVEFIKATVKQLVIHDAGSGLQPYREDSGPYFSIKLHLPYDIHEFQLSHQFYNLFSLAELENRNKTISYYYYLSLIVLLISLLVIKRHDLSVLVWLAILFLVFNAIACGGISVIDNRYQNRIIWIIPFTLLILLMSVIDIEKLKNRINSILTTSNIS